MTLLLQEIKLKNFRNYSELDISDLAGLTILVGPNAIGKTNIIEALQLTTSLTSLKNATVGQLIRWGSSNAYIEATIKNDARNLLLKLEIDEEKKSYYLNGKKKRTKEVRGILSSVCFSPDDLILVKGAQSIKRRNLDSFGIQASANYQTIRKDYEKILHHKNSLLKDEIGFSSNMLEAINETLIKIGAQFILYRRSLLDKLIPNIKKHYEIISSEKEETEIKYLHSWDDLFSDDLEIVDKEAIIRRFEEALRIKSKEEFQRRQSLIGPHADKIKFTLNGKDAALYGSQGQQRSLVLSLKLAEVEVLKNITNQKPVLLLDDVMSELDKERRNSLLNFIQDDIQTFITTTNLEYFPQLILEQAHVIDLSKAQA